MTVLIDTRHYARILCAARRKQNIRSVEAAQMFKVSVRQLHRYENGKEPIPDNVLQSLLYHGYCLLGCRRSKHT